MFKSLLATSFALGLCLAGHAANAAEIEVQMLNKGSDGQAMVFEPAAIKAQVGDIVRFIPKDRGHDAVSIKGLIPEGAADFKGKVNQLVEVKVEKEGIYVVKCSPHFGMGMVAVIAVGEIEPSHVEAINAAKMPKKAKERMNAALSELGL